MIASGVREKKSDFPLTIKGANLEEPYDSYDEEDEGQEEEYGEENYWRDNWNHYLISFIN